MAPESVKQSADLLASEVRSGDRRALGRAITLVESSHPDDREPANRLLELLTPLSGRSIRLGSPSSETATNVNVAEVTRSRSPRPARNTHTSIASSIEVTPRRTTLV